MIANKIIVLFILLTNISLFANELITIKENTTLMTLVRKYAQVKKLNFLESEITDVNIKVIGELTHDMDKFEKIVYFQAFQHGYAVLENEENSSLEMISSRDVRFRELDYITSIDDLPHTYEYVAYLHNMTFMDSDVVVRSLRPFMSRYGRTLSVKSSNQVIIQDSATNIRKLVKIIGLIDTKKNAQREVKAKELSEELKELSKTKESWKTVFKNQFIYILVLFSLLFGIIGFMIRGYVIRSIEGGM